jgi:Type I phosphodiesterase / nucleotide pyrophosphatase
VLVLEGERLVRPDYTGRGLSAIAPTVLQVLTDTQPGLPQLDETVLPDRLSRGVRAVVVLVADGLGQLQLEREVAAGNAPTLGQLMQRAATEVDGCVAFSPITSVFPTTTVAALGSLNSAVLPVEHGLLGYTLYLAEYGLIAEMIRWGPLDQRVSFADPQFGSSPERFFWAETLYQRLHAGGVERTFAVNPSRFAGTALTRMLHQGATYQGYLATSSLTTIVPRLLADRSAGPTYVYSYWPTIDTIAHVLGPESEEHGAEVAAVDAALSRLLDRLPARGDTLLLVTADHGHVRTGPEWHVVLEAHPRLLSWLSAPPAGERRAVYLHTPAVAEVVAYAREHLGDETVVITRSDALREGLFGVEKLSARAEARMGEVLLLPRGNRQVVSAAAAGLPVFHGLHGGLTPEEALVPLLAIRL